MTKPTGNWWPDKAAPLEKALKPDPTLHEIYVLLSHSEFEAVLEKGQAARKSVKDRLALLEAMLDAIENMYPRSRAGTPVEEVERGLRADRASLIKDGARSRVYEHFLDAMMKPGL